MSYQPMHLPFQPQWLGFHLSYCRTRLQEIANLLNREVVYSWNGKDMRFLPQQTSWESYQSWHADLDTGLDDEALRLFGLRRARADSED